MKPMSFSQPKKIEARIGVVAPHMGDAYIVFLKMEYEKYITILLLVQVFLKILVMASIMRVTFNLIFR